MAKSKYKTKIAESVHKTVEDLYSIGLVKKRTMKDFDEMCLTPVKPLSPERIARLREREEVSQAVFARHLGVSLTLISQWERGEKKPSGASLKLLTLVDKKGLAWVA